MKTTARTRCQRGVSLIEALVALAVMAIGMLGLMGVQSSLRSNSDVAKQRSEAVRLAQQEIEGWRAFVTLAGSTTSTNYGDLDSDSGTTIVGTNASFTLTRTVVSLGAPRRGKSLLVDVAWEDRNGEAQRVRLATLIAGIAPELAATLTVPGEGDLVRHPKDVFVASRSRPGISATGPVASSRRAPPSASPGASTTSPA